MTWGLFFVILMYCMTAASTWVCTMVTTMGWTTNGKFNWKGWFMEFKSFLLTIWIIAAAIFILAPICLL